MIETGDLEGAGFVALEIDEPVEDRVRWIAGLLNRCADLLPSSVAVRASQRLLDPKGDLSAAYEVFGRIRLELIAAEESRQERSVRALYVAELSVKVLHNLIIHDQPGPFDRDTGWWLVRTALDGVEDSHERDAWLEVLFPVVRTLWS